MLLQAKNALLSVPEDDAWFETQQAIKEKQLEKPLNRESYSVALLVRLASSHETYFSKNRMFVLYFSSMF